LKQRGILNDHAALTGIRLDNVWNIRTFLKTLSAFIVEMSEPVLECFAGGTVVSNNHRITEC